MIDSIVLKNIGIRLSSIGDVASRIERIVALRDRMAAAFSEYLRTAEGGYLVAQFKAAYPKARVTQVKMLDLVLWKTRSAA